MAKKRAAKSSSATRRASVSPNGRVPKRAARPSKSAGSPRPRPTAARAVLAGPQANGPERAPVRIAPSPDAGLSDKDLAELHAALLAKRAELLGDVKALHTEASRANRQDASGDLSSMPIHMADIGTDNYEQEFTLGLIESERQVLREIDEALDRMKNGTYGLCVATGKPIGRARLKAHPWARYCYDYKLQLEKGQRTGLRA